MVTANIDDILARYDEWADDRERLSEQENTGMPPRSSEWQASDDEAATLLDETVDLLRAIRDGSYV